MPQLIAAETASVNELMVEVIAPATDTLWGAEDPQTDAEWQSLADAANEVIRISTLIKAGGSGPNDNSWAQDPEWQEFADQLLDAAEKSLAAIQAGDIDALFEQGDALYTPCEGCHVVFHPGLQ